MVSCSIKYLEVISIHPKKDWNFHPTIADFWWKLVEMMPVKPHLHCAMHGPIHRTIQIGWIISRIHTHAIYRPICPVANKRIRTERMASVSTDELVLLGLTAVCIATDETSRKRKRRPWCKDWLLKRRKYSHVNLSELQLEPGDWFIYLGMSHETYMEWLSLVRPYTEKQELHY